MDEHVIELSELAERVIDLVEVDGHVGGPLSPAQVARQRLGARLRTARHVQGLRLEDVEERSEQRIDAELLDAYERGERAIPAPTLAALAGVYGVPSADLRPDPERPDVAVRLAEAGRPTATRVRRRIGLDLRLSVPALHACTDPEVGPLQEVVRHVRVLRGDLDGQVLTVRGDDLRTVADQLGLELEALPAWLAARGLLAGP